MANTINYEEIFQNALDDLMVQEATTGWMEANAGQVQYNGGATVKIPKMSMDGLGNYSRSSGYPAGDVTLTWETKTMTQDRGRQLVIDAMDVDETNFVASASRISSEFQRTKVVPEIDAYRLSMLATEAITAGTNVETGYTPSATDILAKIEAAIASVKKSGFRGQALMIHATSDVVAALELAAGDRIRQATFSQGGIDLTVPSINGYPIIETDDDRMVTAITVGTNGWSKGASASDVNFLVVARNVPIAVSKQDKVRIFNPDVNQDADAWKIDYRRYHDLWVLENKVGGIAINTK